MVLQISRAPPAVRTGFYEQPAQQSSFTSPVASAAGYSGSAYSAVVNDVMLRDESARVTGLNRHIACGCMTECSRSADFYRI